MITHTNHQVTVYRKPAK